MSRTRSCERGFTLAGLIVVMTIMAVFIAFTVPKQWSMIMARERDQQTLFAMKQYARAIQAFQQKNGNALPVSLDQLKQARNPRYLRGSGELICPLTGKADWIPIPASAAQPGAQPGPGQGGMPGGIQVPRPPARPGLQPGTGQPGQPGAMVGPIVGVRPNKTGESFLEPNGATSYEQWSYTVLDLQNEILARQNAMLAK
jgi:type II secretory pathway pseudopilin PulG